MNYTLSRNHNGDMLLLESGKPVQLVAGLGTGLWYAIVGILDKDHELQEWRESLLKQQTERKAEPAAEPGTALIENLCSFLDRIIKAASDGTIHPELFEGDADTLREVIDRLSKKETSVQQAEPVDQATITVDGIRACIYGNTHPADGWHAAFFAESEVDDVCRQIMSKAGQCTAPQQAERMHGIVEESVAAEGKVKP